MDGAGTQSVAPAGVPGHRRAWRQGRQRVAGSELGWPGKAAWRAGGVSPTLQAPCSPPAASAPTAPPSVTRSAKVMQVALLAWYSLRARVSGFRPALPPLSKSSANLCQPPSERAQQGGGKPAGSRWVLHAAQEQRHSPGGHTQASTATHCSRRCGPRRSRWRRHGSPAQGGRRCGVNSEARAGGQIEEARRAPLCPGLPPPAQGRHHPPLTMRNSFGRLAACSASSIRSRAICSGEEGARGAGAGAGWVGGGRG